MREVLSTPSNAAGLHGFRQGLYFCQGLLIPFE
jgi:hypothetical protein